MQTKESDKMAKSTMERLRELQGNSVPRETAEERAQRIQDAKVMASTLQAAELVHKFSKPPSPAPPQSAKSILHDGPHGESVLIGEELEAAYFNNRVYVGSTPHNQINLNSSQYSRGRWAMTLDGEFVVITWNDGNKDHETIVPLANVASMVRKRDRASGPS